MTLSGANLASTLLLVTPALWSVNYIVARSAPGVIEPHTLALLRWSLAFVVMLPFAWRELLERWPQWRHEWKDLLLIGALGMWICGAFVYIGARTTPAVNMSLLYSAAPVMVAAASAIWFHDRLSLRQWMGAALALSGMLLIVAKGDWQTLAQMQFTVGDGWILCAVLSWACYALMLKNRKSSLGVFSRSAAITLGGVIVLIPFTIWEWVSTPVMPAFGIKAFGLALTAALIPGVGAYQAYAYVQKELGAAKAGLVLYLGPLYSALTAWMFLGEQPHMFHIAGGALILPGVYFATRQR